MKFMKINAHALAAHGALKVSVPPCAIGGSAAERNLAPSTYFMATRQLRHVGVGLEANGALSVALIVSGNAAMLRADVPLEAARRPERLVARLALVRLLALVHRADVHLEVARLRERLAARLAHMLPLATVDRPARNAIRIGGRALRAAAGRSRGRRHFARG